MSNYIFSDNTITIITESNLNTTRNNITIVNDMNSNNVPDYFFNVDYLLISHFSLSFDTLINMLSKNYKISYKIGENLENLKSTILKTVIPTDNIQSIIIEYIDRGVTNMELLGFILKNKYPNLKYLYIDQNYSYIDYQNDNLITFENLYKYLNLEILFVNDIQSSVYDIINY
jgi:hypothetical protein